MEIKGVRTVKLGLNEDERGYLFEAVHRSDEWVSGQGEEIRQVYVVGDRLERIVRAFHKHERLHDWFCIVRGSAKYCLADDRKDSPTYGAVQSVVASAREPKLVIVPPGVYHGWMSLEPDTIMVSTASHEYNKASPDETRVPPDHFDKAFGGSPWEIRGK